MLSATINTFIESQRVYLQLEAAKACYVLQKTPIYSQREATRSWRLSQLAKCYKKHLYRVTERLLTAGGCHSLVNATRNISIESQRVYSQLEAATAL